MGPWSCSGAAAAARVGLAVRRLAAGQVRVRWRLQARRGIGVLDRLFLEWRPSGAEIERLFRRVEEVLVAVHGMFPDLAAWENDWFAARMHESPFAIPIGEGPAQRAGR